MSDWGKVARTAAACAKFIWRNGCLVQISMVAVDDALRVTLAPLLRDMADELGGFDDFGVALADDLTGGEVWVSRGATTLRRSFALPSVAVQ